MVERRPHPATSGLVSVQGAGLMCLSPGRISLLPAELWAGYIHFGSSEVVDFCGGLVCRVASCDGSLVSTVNVPVVGGVSQG